MRRLLVARAPHWDAANKSLIEVPAHVGVLRWGFGGEIPDVTLDPALGNTCHFVTIVVRAAASFRGAPSAAPPPLRRADFAPHKLETDLLVRGRAPAGALQLQVGERRKALDVVDPANLATGTRDARGERARLEPDLDLGAAAAGEARLVEGAWARNQEATPAVRIPWPQGDEAFSILLADGQTLEGTLPSRVPYVRLVSRTEAPDRIVPLSLDTIDVDLGDERRVILTYRGIGAVQRPDARDVDRVDVVWWPAAEPFVFALAEAEIPRAEVEHAWELEDVEQGVLPPALTGDDLAVARFETWDVAHGPLPTMPIERVTKLAAELGEQREPRERVLARHGVSSYAWDVEERAWQQSLGEAEVRNDGDDRPSLAESYAEHFLAAQDALARPEEAKWTARDYAKVTAAMDVDEPARALVEQRFTLGEYQRLDRRMQRQAAGDRAFAAELSRLLAEARAEAQAARRARRPSAADGEDAEEDDDA